MIRTMLFAVVAALTMLSVFFGVASADLNFGHRIYSTSTCGGAQKDPVHLMFWGNGVLSVTLNEFASHVGWSYTDGSTMYFADHGVCTSQDAQRASAPDYYWQRGHIRFEYVEYYSPYYYYTIAAAHMDWCYPHVAIDYDYVRDALANAFAAAGHSVQSRAWSSPGSIWVVCLGDGWYEYFDGNWKLIEL